MGAPPAPAWGLLSARDSTPTRAVSLYMWFASGAIAHSWREARSTAQ
jgi:hypothetical protein